jgi:hypothetical protein
MCWTHHALSSNHNFKEKLFYIIHSLRIFTEHRLINTFLSVVEYNFIIVIIQEYGTIILPVVLYGCETWSLTLREERRLRVLENMVLRRIFGPRRDEVTGEWRRLHNEELNDLYCSPNIVRVIKSRRMRWAGHVARMGEERGCIGSWWGNRMERDHWGDLGVDG